MVRAFLAVIVVSSLAAYPALATAPSKAKHAKHAKIVARVGNNLSQKETVRPAPRVLIATPSLEPRLRQSLTDAVNQPALDGADFGFFAARLKDGEVLAETGADTLINPASNAKLVTAAAALDTLKAEHRFKTEYFVHGVLKDGTLNGNLVVKGYGDPSIVSERLSRVANELYLLGIEKITGNVVLDASYFDDVEEPRGWELEDAPDRAYAAPISALSVNFNAVAVYVRPGDVGKPAVVRVDPPCEHVVLDAKVTTDPLGHGVHILSQPIWSQPESSQKDKPAQGQTLLTVNGSVGAREAPSRTYRRVYEPVKYFGSMLVHFLQERGVKMRHAIVTGPVPDNARLILVDKSPRLADIITD